MLKLNMCWWLLINNSSGKAWPKLFISIGFNDVSTILQQLSSVVTGTKQLSDLCVTLVWRHIWQQRMAIFCHKEKIHPGFKPQTFGTGVWYFTYQAARLGKDMQIITETQKASSMRNCHIFSSLRHNVEVDTHQHKNKR